MSVGDDVQRSYQGPRDPRPPCEICGNTGVLARFPYGPCECRRECDCCLTDGTFPRYVERTGGSDGEWLCAECLAEIDALANWSIPLPTRKKRGPGHPVTTGSAGVPPVFYRVSAAQHAELKAEGRAAKPRLTPNAVAKRRAFPGTKP